ncbi:MAG: hypothetical protein NZ455_11975 [Bacteroidia bacterium]|nr:hypothetical protein [Bacteroidia bacterium]MDW8347179.1 hypothetical protein [Bacteroidia bacterium]
MGVSLACARVGVLRATLTLRCFASLRTAHAPSACLTQQPCDFLPYFRHILALPCLILIIKYLQK